MESEEQIVAKVSKLSIQTVKEAQFSFVDPSRFSKWSILIRTIIWTLKFIKQTATEKIARLQPISAEGKRITSEDFKLAKWVLIRQMRYEGINEEEKKKWNLYRDDRKLWRSKNQLENLELDNKSQERTQKKHVNPKTAKNRPSTIRTIGEIALVDETNTPRGLWKLARIKKLKKGKTWDSKNYVGENVQRRLLSEANQHDICSRNRRMVDEKVKSTTPNPDENISSRTRSAMKRRYPVEQDSA
ncbi:Fanconi anemia core complex-associated protein [Dirofilaria immitis]